ncbi:MAG: hypothetical protein RML35_08690 [Chloroherpetonaceae bacterium]|nr:hypothetical protein [Chloroherpetonaceae bacterium]
MTRILFIPLTTLLFVAFIPLGWHTHRVAGVRVWVPDDWKVETRNNTLSATSPDGEVYVGYIIASASDFEHTLESLTNDLRSVVQDAKFDKTHDDFAIDGMPAWGFGGTGTHDGTPVEMRLELIYTPKKRVLIVVAVGSHSGLEHHLQEVVQMLRGIKKA